MMDFMDKLQQAWQSQSCKTVAVNPDQLLKTARLQRRVYLFTDIFLVSVFTFFTAYMSWSAFKKDIHEDWPWLVSAASSSWVVGYILFNRWRQGRRAAHYDDSLLAHVERSINDTEHRMRQDQNSLWWYILPIAFGCMTPPVSFFAKADGRPPWDSLIPLLTSEGLLIITFVFVHLVIKYAGRVGLEARRKELEGLRALRETLLSEELGK